MGMEGVEIYQGIKIRKDGSFMAKITKSEFGGRGWFNVKITDGRMKLVKYNTRNSPFHNMTTCPAHTLLKLPLERGNFWHEKGESNYFILRSKTKIKALGKRIAVPAGKFSCLEIETEFEIPKKYTGPPYSKKRYWFSEEVGVVRLEVDYRSGERDIAVLEKYQVSGQGYWPFRVGNSWTYLWTCQWGPNKDNTHNTRQEERHKPPKP